MRVPESLWRKLHNKVRPRICSVLTAVANHTVQHQPLTLFLPLAAQVKNEIFDSGNYFQFAMDEDGNMLLMLNDELENGLAAGSDVFLVDHFWTTTIDNSRNQVRALYIIRL